MSEVRAVVIDGFGDSPHLATFPLPALAPDEVLVEVQAASVNAFDWKVAEGRFKDSFDYQFPVTIGRDYAGVVRAVGGEVRRVAPGDLGLRVLHRADAAPRLVRHARLGRRGRVFRAPAAGAPAACRRLPAAGGRGGAALPRRCPAGRGDRILILGAPGGVGSLAVQLAASAGAHVIASGPAADAAYLTGLGAADVIPPGEGLVSEVSGRYPDGIAGLIDLVSYRPAFLAHAGLLAPGGRAASVHRAVDDAAFASRGLRGANVTSAPDRALLNRLAGLAVTGELRVPVTGRYTLDQAVSALADARDQHTRGKLVIEMSR